MLRKTILILGIIIPFFTFQRIAHSQEVSCKYYYFDECWTRYTSRMLGMEKFVADPITGMLVRQDRTARRIELLNKARAILCNSPPLAPRSEVWLVYNELKRQERLFRILKARRDRATEKVKIRPRRK